MKRKRYSEPCRKFDPRGTVTYSITVDDGGKTRRVKKRGYAGWYLREYDPETRRQRWIWAGESVEDARLHRDHLSDQAAKGEEEIKPVPFEQAAQEFLDSERARLTHDSAGFTPEDYKAEPTRWLQELHRRIGKLKVAFAGKAVRDIAFADLDQYFARRGGGPKTKNEDLYILRMLFEWALKCRYAAINPAKDKDSWKLPRPTTRTLTREEEANLLDACSRPYRVDGISGNRNVGGREGAVTTPSTSRWSQTFTPPAWLHPLVLLALRSTLRLGNLLCLEWRHVDLKRRIIRIPGKELKNGVDLELPIHPEAADLLASLRRKGEGQKVTALRVLAAVEAPGATGSGRRTVARVFSGAVARAGLPAGFTFHSLRKVGATRMLHAGVDLKTVMAVGGWIDPTTLLKHYAATTDEAKRAAVANL